MDFKLKEHFQFNVCKLFDTEMSIARGFEENVMVYITAMASQVTTVDQGGE